METAPFLCHFNYVQYIASIMTCLFVCCAVPCLAIPPSPIVTQKMGSAGATMKFPTCTDYTIIKSTGSLGQKRNRMARKKWKECAQYAHLCVQRRIINDASDDGWHGKQRRRQQQAITR